MTLLRECGNILMRTEDMPMLLIVLLKEDLKAHTRPDLCNPMKILYNCALIKPVVRCSAHINKSPLCGVVFRRVSSCCRI